MRKFLPVLLILFLVVGCATTSRTPIHKIVGSSTVRTKVVLLDSGNVDKAYQKVAVREFEAKLLKQPVSYTIRSTIGGQKVDLVLITRKEVQVLRSSSPQELIAVGKESDVNTLIVLEPLKVEYSEGSAKRGEEFCVVRRAYVVIRAKVYETNRGSLIFGGVYDGKAEARQCSKGIQRTDKLPNRDSLVVRAVKKAAEKFAGDFWSAL